jgi:glycosyltransferase involved in cell wall biosynthesis
MNPKISIIVPTYRHAKELVDVMFSLEEAQSGVLLNEYEIIIINDDPKDLETKKIAQKYYLSHKNVRYIEIYDAKESGITNAGRCGNIGARSFARGEILILMVDSARIVTPYAIAKTKEAFEKYGKNICTTVLPYHIGKFYKDPNWTPEDCQKLMEDINWKKNPYVLFDYKADTYISKTGILKESTFQGMTKQAFLDIGGWNEIFPSWGVHNLDLWRRCVMPKPLDGIQEVGTPGKWGKVGYGLESILLEGEGTFHIHHDITVPRDHSNFDSDNKLAWGEYEKLGDCIKANITRPNWGKADCKEIDLSKD